MESIVRTDAGRILGITKDSPVYGSDFYEGTPIKEEEL